MSVLALGEVLKTPRLRISAAATADIESSKGWLAASLKPEWAIEDLMAAVVDRGALGVRDGDGTLLGIAVVLVDSPEARAATVPFVAVIPERRFRGLGGEACIAIERRLRQARFARVYAPVPETRGLAVYFWLRLGFRPVTRAHAPWPLVGLDQNRVPGVWLMREEN